MSNIDKQAVTAKIKELASLMVERFSMNPVSCKLLNEAWKKEFPDEVAIAEHQLHMAELAKCNLRASRKAQFRKRKAAERRIAELEAREIKPAKGEVLVVVSGFTGCGKSAIAGEIEIAMKAIGVPVQWTNGDAEKHMTGADWLTAIEMYKPTVRIVEVNVPRAAGIKVEGELCHSKPFWTCVVAPVCSGSTNRTPAAYSLISAPKRIPCATVVAWLSVLT